MLRTEFDDTAYRTWLAPLQLSGLEGDRVLLAVPTRFLRDWIAAHYADRIRALWRSRSIRAVVRDRAGRRGRRTVRPRRHAAARRAAPARPAARRGAVGAARSRPATSDIGAPLDPRFTFDDFVVGKSNQLAYAAARRVAEPRRAAVQPAVPLWRRSASARPI